MNIKRVRKLNNKPIADGEIIYWMSRDQRVEDNWAMVYANNLAKENGRKFKVIFTLDFSYPLANFRSFSFMLEGLKKVQDKLFELNISFELLIGNPIEKLIDYYKIHKVGAIVNDFDPLKIKKYWKQEIAKVIDCAFFEVDAHNIVPAFYVSDKQEFAAYTIRPKLHKLLKEFLEEYTKIDYYSLNGQIDKIDYFKDINDYLKNVDYVSPAQFKPGADEAYRLLNDLDFLGITDVQPIGNSDQPFLGTFDGNGHSIKNLKIKIDIELSDVGLFGCTENCVEITKLALENVTIDATGSENVGSLVGYSYGSKITYCFSTGSVFGKDAAGGLIGTAIDSTIKNSYSHCSTIGLNSVGGLVGLNVNTLVDKCYSVGSVAGENGVGGLIGYSDNSEKITNSFWDVETSGQSSSAGGEGKTTEEMKTQNTFVDWDFVRVWTILESKTYPYFRWKTTIVPNLSGKTKEEAETTLLSFGLFLGSPVSYQYSSTIETDLVVRQSFEPGTVVPCGEEVHIMLSKGVPPSIILIDSIEEFQLIGIDSDYPSDATYNISTDLDGSTISNWNGSDGFNPIDVFTGVIDGLNHVIYDLFIDRETDVSIFNTFSGHLSNLGLVRASFVSSTNKVSAFTMNNDGTIENCFSIADFTTSSNISAFVFNNSGTILNCYSLGMIHIGDPLAAVSAFVYHNNGNSGNVSCCYSSVKFNPRTARVYGMCASGSPGDSQNSYYDTVVEEIGVSIIGVGKTTSEMKTQSTFENWDFDNIWTITQDGDKASYPYLRNSTILSVPSLVDQEEDVAIKKIYYNGFLLGSRTYEYSEDVTTNVVSQQSLEANSVAYPGYVIDLVIQKPYIQVPNIVGYSLDDATLILRSSKLKFEISYEYNEDYSSGIVFEQDPEAGSNAEENDIITIKVSKDIGVDVPDLIGFNIEDAVTALSGLGLDSSTVYEFSDDVVKNCVINQNPTAGSVVGIGSTVVLIVSLGIGVVVPNVVGMNIDDATTELKKLKFNTKITYKKDDKTEIHTVLSQSPSASVIYELNGIVSLIVSSGTITTTPDLTDRDIKKAEELLRLYRLKLGNLTYVCSNFPKGYVLGQQYVETTFLEPLTKVDLILSGGRCFTMPNLIEKTKTETEVILRSLNHSGKTEVFYTCIGLYDYLTKDLIVDQYPKVGETVFLDTDVSIFIAQNGECTEVPCVIGLDFEEDEVVRRIQDASLEYEIIRVYNDNPDLHGKVIDQQPSCNGTTKYVIKGTLIKLYVSYNKIVIRSAEDLTLLGSDERVHLYELGCDIDASVTKDWDDGKGFNPVGKPDFPFCETFDGNGYTIKNLYINRPNQSNVGLFSRLGEGAVIKNVKFSNVQIVGRENVGIVTGSSYLSTVEKVTVSGNVSGSSNVGGIVGLQTGGTIRACGTISSSYGDEIIHVSGSKNVGGIVGNSRSIDDDHIGLICFNNKKDRKVLLSDFSFLDKINSSFSLVTKCYLYKSEVKSNSDSCGGICGLNEGIISKSTVRSCHVVAGRYAGGLVGTNRSLIYNCLVESYTNLSEKSKVESSNSVSGGLVGILEGGIVLLSSSTDTIVSSVYSIAGGLVGTAIVYIIGNTKLVPYIYDSYSRDNFITSNSNVGGFVATLGLEVANNTDLSTEQDVVVRCYCSNTLESLSSFGGFCARKNDKYQILCSYWNVTKSSVYISDGGEGKTDDAMKLSSTYNNWDFVNIWKITENEYPWLKFSFDFD